MTTTETDLQVPKPRSSDAQLEHVADIPAIRPFPRLGVTQSGQAL